MTRLIVEAAFGYSVIDPSPQWTADITRYVDIRAAGIQISRGASDEIEEIQPGTCTLTLDNSDGRFTPGLATSPYYPNVKKNVPIRVRVISAGKNLITNPGFETDLTDWQKTFSPVIDRVNGPHTGTWSMRVTWGAPSGQAVFIDVNGLDIGQRYTASAYVWTQSAAGSLFCYIENDGVGTTSTLTAAWERIAITFTATATRHKFVIQTSGAPTAGSQSWVDSVQLEEGSTATDFDPVGAVVHDRFWGMVNQWPTAWKGLHARTLITATDLFKWASRQPALRPMLIEEVLQDRPRAYYPLAEDSESTTAGDLSGYGAGSFSIVQAGSGGTLEFDAGAGPADSLGCPKFSPASASAGKFLRASLGASFTAAAVAAGQAMFIEVWFSSGTPGRNILTLASMDSASQLSFSLNISGQISVNRSIDGQFGVFPDAFTGNLADDGVHHLLVDIAAQRIYIDGANKGTSPLARAVDTPGRLYLGARGPNSDDSGTTALWAGTIAHVALYIGDGLTASDLLPHYTTGNTENVGESATVRAARIAGYNGLSIGFQGSTFGAMGSQKALGRPALEHLREVASTEGGRLFSSRSAGQLILQSRDVRNAPVPLLTLDWADTEDDEPEYADDDQKMVNTVEATRPGGAIQRVTDATSRATYGPYEEQIDLFKDSDSAALAAAQWLVSRYADPPPELRQLAVEAYSLGLTSYRALLGTDISSAIGVTNLPTQAPISAATVTVEGYEETIQYRQHLLNFRTSRTLNSTVWILDSATYGVLGTTTRLGY
ncbi:carbohydrate binding domain-containing protein [Stenotrophomonas sp. NPDC087984]